MGTSACVSLDALSAYSDGELSDAERRLVQRHLGACARCSAQLASFGRLDSVLAGPPGLGCASALPLLSARHDRELTLAETLAAEAHLARCPSCRSAVATWGRVDEIIAKFPAGVPSRRVDVAVSALGANTAGRTPLGRPLPAGVAVRAAIAVSLVVVVAIAAIQQPESPSQARLPASAGGGQQALAPLAPIGGQKAFVAAAQQSLLNPRTNTLYVAHPDQGLVGALNATSLAEIASIDVGGRPSALALNDAANTVLVLDSTQKTITEIDGNTNAVLGTTTVSIADTPTALQVDPTSGSIVVTAVATAQPQGPDSGSVTVLDGTSKKLQSTQTVSVAPRQVVFDGQGKRALLVSEDFVTVVDAATYQTLDQLPGGVAAVFAARGNETAVVSNASGGARLTIAGDRNATLTLIGAPLAMLALPQGGFAVLVVDGTHGRIVEIAAAASPSRPSVASRSFRRRPRLRTRSLRLVQARPQQSQARPPGRRRRSPSGRPPL